MLCLAQLALNARDSMGLIGTPILPPPSPPRPFETTNPEQPAAGGPKCPPGGGRGHQRSPPQADWQEHGAPVRTNHHHHHREANAKIQIGTVESPRDSSDGLKPSESMSNGGCHWQESKTVPAVRWGCPERFGPSAAFPGTSVFRKAYRALRHHQRAGFGGGFGRICGPFLESNLMIPKKI